MKRAIIAAAVVSAVLCAAPALRAETIYLKNGYEIDCQRSWQEKGTVYVQINPRSTIEFAPEEVDLERTAGGAKGERHVSRKPHGNGAKHPAPGTSTGAHHGESAGGGNEPPTAVAGSLHIGGANREEIVRKELDAVYGKFYAALRCGRYREQLKYVVGEERTHVEKMVKMPAGQREFVSKMMRTLAPSYAVTGSSVAPDGKSATLDTVRRVPFIAYDVAAGQETPDYKEIATVVQFVRMGSEWKISSVKER